MPVPGALLLFGSGLAGLYDSACRRRKGGLP
ncbi:MAG: PEP-CTERM sorting domain-containing protein [Deltaproteobacteria bacterium]|nr:PEP-CTERM sorting domain-containing protein [Deltaproteobacteria bacterium]